MHRERNGSNLVSVNPFTDTEVDTLKEAFDWHALDIVVVDRCPSERYCKVIEFSCVGLNKGHPLVCCSSSGGCQSQLSTKGSCLCPE